MTRTGKPSHERARPLDVATFVFRDDLDAWLGSVDGVDVLVEGTPKGGIPEAAQRTFESTLDKLKRHATEASEAIVEAAELPLDERPMLVRVDCRPSRRRTFELAFIVEGDGAHEWVAEFVGTRLNSVRRKPTWFEG